MRLWEPASVKRIIALVNVHACIVFFYLHPDVACLLKTSWNLSAGHLANTDLSLNLPELCSHLGELSLYSRIPHQSINILGQAVLQRVRTTYALLAADLSNDIHERRKMRKEFNPLAFWTLLGTLSCR